MYFRIFILFTILVFCNAGNIYFEGCDDPSTGPNDKCAFNELSIFPCLMSNAQGVCSIRKPSHATLVMSYVPFFSGKTFFNIYHASSKGESALLLTPYLCGTVLNNTLCESAYAVPINSTYNWRISGNIPYGEQRFKLRLWNEKRHECCITFKLNLLEPSAYNCN